MWMQVLLMVVTLGLYSIYWYYATLKELKVANGKDANVGLWVVLSAIPIVQLFAEWHYCTEFETFTGERYQKILIFLLWVFFPASVWFISQRELNRVSTAPA